MARRLLEMTALALLAACAPPKPPPAPKPVALPHFSMTVTHPEHDRFHVVYESERASLELPFERPGHGVRESWTAAPEPIVVEGERMRSKEARAHWAFDIPVGDFQPEKDYRTTYRYADGSTLLYTGHLAIRKGEWIRLVAGPGENVVVRGQKPGPEVGIELKTDGVYAYFGKEAPRETADFIGVIDRGFPAELRARLDDDVPRFFAYFGEQLGRPARASEKPLLFASYALLPNPAWLDVGGGMMPPRSVNVHIGVGPGELEPWKKSQIDFVLAHEIAHLWNGDLYGTEDEKNGSWMREGSADVLAFRAMHHAGVLDEHGYRERLSDAISLCLLALDEGGGLSGASRPGHARDSYTCGATLTLLSAAASRLEVTSFLHEVFAGPGNQYDGARWFATIEAHHGRADVARALAEGRLGDVPRALGEAGLALAPKTEPSRDVETRTSPFAVRALLSPACVDALALPGNVRVEPMVKVDGACGSAVKGDRFDRLAGVALGEHGAAAFDAGYAQCVAHRKVVVGRKGKSDIELPCSSSPRKRIPYYEISKLP